MAIELVMEMNAGDVCSFGVDSNSRIKLRDLVSEYELVNQVKLNIKWGEEPYREREVMEPCDNLNNIPGWKPLIPLAYGLNKVNR